MLLAPITQFRVPSGTFPASLPATVADLSDHDLMIAVRAGEIRRLGELFERYHRPAFSGPGGKIVSGTLNGGGVDIKISTMNGEITLRQTK